MNLKTSLTNQRVSEKWLFTRWALLLKRLFLSKAPPLTHLLRPLLTLSSNLRPSCPVGMCVTFLQSARQSVVCRIMCCHSLWYAFVRWLVKVRFTVSFWFKYQLMLIWNGNVKEGYVTYNSVSWAHKHTRKRKMFVFFFFFPNTTLSADSTEDLNDHVGLLLTVPSKCFYTSTPLPCKLCGKAQWCTTCCVQLVFGHWMQAAQFKASSGHSDGDSSSALLLLLFRWWM